jgi:serine/threonine-protein kinase
MGEVLQGRHRLLDRLVAIKLRARTRGREEHRLAARFRHTATLQAELDHPHIAQVLDYIEQPQRQAMVLTFLQGGSVADLLERGRPDVADVITMGIHAAEALAYAHRRGIVHRDIKPDNLMLQFEGDPHSLRVTDFGVAKTTDRSPDLTVAGANVGTVWYMCPEQFNHENPTPTFDIYALGATLYEMLTGSIPFESQERAAVFSRFLDKVPPPPIRSRATAVPPALAAVVEASIALTAGHRPPSAAALALLLRAVASAEGISIQDEKARALFGLADGPALRTMLRQMPGKAGAEALQAFTHLDSRINGSTAVTRLDLPQMQAALPILEVMLEDDIYEDDEDNTLVMSAIDVDDE